MRLIWRTDSRFFSHRPLNDSFGKIGVHTANFGCLGVAEFSPYWDLVLEFASNNPCP